MARENVLRLIPGDFFSVAGQTLPDAETDTKEVREVEIDVPQWFKAKIRFKRFHFRRGKMN